MAFFNSTTLTLVIFSLLSLFLFSSEFCYADTNGAKGGRCGTESLGSVARQSNLNDVLNNLTANVGSNGGYYATEAGEDPDTMYGLIQCRGDISTSDCSSCASQDVATLRMLHIGRDGATYVIRLIISTVSGTHRVGLLSYSGSTTESTTVVGNGRSMMMQLVGGAQNGTMRFATSDIDDGMGGKRYGMVQCTRDLETSACTDCLNYLVSFIYENKTTDPMSWEVYATGCAVWYDSARFSDTTNSDAPPPVLQGPREPLTTPDSTGTVPRPHYNLANRFQAVTFWTGIIILIATMAHII